MTDMSFMCSIAASCTRRPLSCSDYSRANVTLTLLCTTFRITPTFETGLEKYAWLNHLVSVGVGRRTPTGLSYRIYAIL